MGSMCRYHITMLVTDEEEHSIRSMYKEKDWTCLLNVLSDETVANVFQSGFCNIFPREDFKDSPADFTVIKTEVVSAEADVNEADKAINDNKANTEKTEEESNNDERTDSASETDTAEETGTASESDISNETTMDGSYVCNICKMMYKSISGFREHEKCHAGNSSNRHCGKMLFSRENLNRHRELENVCSKCGKVFKYRKNLVTHEKAHVGLLPFRCCGIGFPSSRSFQRHRCTVHSEAKHFICRTCGKVFATQSDLTSHIVREARQNSVLCDICGHRTATTVDMDQHMMTHKDEKSHICKTCGARFKHHSSMYRHIKKKHIND